MKRIVFYLFALNLFLGLSISCSSDDDNGPATNSGIYGKWYAKEFTMQGHMAGEDGEDDFDFTAVSVNLNDDNFVIFNEDGTFTGSNSEIQMEFTYSVNGVPLPPTTQTVSSDFSEIGTWNKDGNDLYVKADGDEETSRYLITELSANTLKLFADQTHIEMDDTTDGSTFEINLTFKR